MSHQPSPKATAIEPLRVGVNEAARILGISRATLYKHLKAGTLRAVKDGKRTLLTMAELRAYVSESEPTNVGNVSGHG